MNLLAQRSDGPRTGSMETVPDKVALRSIYPQTHCDDTPTSRSNSALQRSLMTADEKDLIDLEVTSFMTACAAGVDALKALLQRERLRRIEQEAAAARATEEDGRGLQDSGGGGGGELQPGSRPAHEHAAVTFLFERLKAVTEVAETMQVG